MNFSIFNLKKKSLKLTDPTTTLKGQYLGNVSTNVAKGDACTDRPLDLLWKNFVKTTGKQSVAMKISVDNSGLKVYTTNQGLTHYWCHRITYFCVPKSNEKLFVWIYRHVGKKLRVELRCHAILLSNEKKANSLVELLREKVNASLQEYRREKSLKHRRRLRDEKAAAHLSQHGEFQGQTRTKHLVTSKNYKPPTEYSLSSPTLTAISEEAACSSSDDSDSPRSTYSTLGRWSDMWTIDSESDLNMNEFSPNGGYKHLGCTAVSGFATLPRQHWPKSKKKLQKQLLVDRLQTLVINNSSDSDDDFELESDFNDKEYSDKMEEMSDGSSQSADIQIEPFGGESLSFSDISPQEAVKDDCSFSAEGCASSVNTNSCPTSSSHSIEVTERNSENLKSTDLKDDCESLPFISTTSTQKLSQTSNSLDIAPSFFANGNWNNSVTSDVSGTTPAHDSKSFQYSRSPGRSTDRGFESDCSDSSVEIIRIITRL